MSGASGGALFALSELVAAQAVLKRCALAAGRAPLTLALAGLRGLGLLLVLIIEFEILYQVFAYLTGETDGTWSAALMACTAVIMVAGFHLQAHANPGAWAVRFVKRAVSIMTPLYLLGAGLLVASILFADGLADLVQSAAPLMLDAGPLEFESGSGWLQGGFETIISPLAVLLFSLGIGGLAIINIYVAHRLLSLMSADVGLAMDRLRRVRRAVADYRAMRAAQTTFEEISAQIDALDEAHSDEAIRDAITGEVLGVMEDALFPHRKLLQERRLQPQSRFDPGDGFDADHVADAIARIEAITPAQIYAAMDAPGGAAHPASAETAQSAATTPTTP